MLQFAAPALVTGIWTATVWGTRGPILGSRSAEQVARSYRAQCAFTFALAASATLAALRVLALAPTARCSLPVGAPGSVCVAAFMLGIVFTGGYLMRVRSPSGHSGEADADVATRERDATGLNASLVLASFGFSLSC